LRFREKIGLEQIWDVLARLEVPTATLMNIQVFWAMVLCRWGIVTGVSKKLAASILRVAQEG
jgi:hypothetical protein